MKISKTGIAVVLCAGMATAAIADLHKIESTNAETTMQSRMRIVDSLTRLAENDPTDATIRMKLALVLDSMSMHEEAEWWRADAMNINPEIATTGMIETAEDIPLHDIMARGAGVGSVCNQPIGPDVIVGSLHDLRRWGQNNGITSYSVGTTSCNIGDERLDWFDNNVNHPVIAQDMFKWEPFSVGDDNGRFKQLGQSWLKHGFFALSNNICCPSCQGTSGSQLGIGCADPYGAGLNGSFSELGPRSEVNGATGFFYQYPHSSPSGNSTLRGRIQVQNTELDQANAVNADSIYLVDGLYIAKDDALEGNDNNNASYRTINVSSSGTTHSISYNGSTQREAAAIQHWGEVEAGVTTRFIDDPGDGRYIAAYNVSDNGDGTWHYEYAVYNLTSEDAADGFTVPVPDGVSVTNISFHDVDCHSGEPYDNTDWTGVRNTNDVTWEAPAFSPSADRNAIRWGTLYNFGFDADTEPMTVSVSLDQLSGGSTPAFDIDAPEAAVSCPGDINGDGVIDTADLGILIAEFGNRGDPQPGDLNGDMTVDTADLGILISLFGTSCP